MKLKELHAVGSILFSNIRLMWNLKKKEKKTLTIYPMMIIQDIADLCRY